jgi:glycosyltransferase involved in cell wall biosynthesis
MEIGGSQTNAIELAQAVSNLGHEVVVFGPRGALVDRVQEMGLEFIASPVEHSWPSRRNIRALTELVRHRAIDLVHAYEWGPAAEAALGPRSRLATPVVVTVYSMSVPPFIPTHVPLIVGTRKLSVDTSRDRSNVHLLEPPIDTALNAPSGSTARERAQFGVDPEDLVIGVVGRLVPDLGKLSGVLDAIDAVDLLCAQYRVRLLVVGDGQGYQVAHDRASMVNRAHGREVVIMTGSLLDPRAAYAAADIALGMGSSAMKAMAFGKPLVVQGEDGFARLLNEDSLSSFLSAGWHGHGGRGVADLLIALEPLLSDAGLRAALGAMGRETVTARYSLDRAAVGVDRLYRDSLARRPGRISSWSGITTLSLELAKFKFALIRQGWSSHEGGSVAA